MDAQRRPTYSQKWHEYNLAQTNEKAKFQELLFDLCQLIEEPPQVMGRPRVPVADRIFSAAFKVYSTLSGRRFTSDLREAKQRGYLSRMPHYNSIFRYLESEELTPYLKLLITESSLPLRDLELDFAVDSSGFTTTRFVRWVTVRNAYGNNKEVDGHDWLKAHIMCGCKTNIITSVEVTGRHANDSPYFAPLVEHTSRNFVMNQVTADKAYSSNKNLQLVLSKAAMPYIAFRANATGKSPGQSAAWRRMYHMFQTEREWFMSHYHRRSNVETTFSMIKRKFGDHLRSKTRTAQINEVLLKILCHNLCCVIQSIYEFNAEATFGAEDIFAPKVTSL